VRGSMHEVGDGHWRLRVFAGRENGKARHISRYFRGTKRQAQGALARLVTEVEQHRSVPRAPARLASCSTVGSTT
jgi:hypothetical protein